MEKEKRKKVIAVRFFDRIAQCSVFERTATSIKETGIPLYIGFKPDKLLLFGEGYNDSVGFGLMNTRKYVNDKLNEVREKLPYKIPENADMLWKYIIWKLFAEKFIPSIEERIYKVEGILVVLPEYMDISLREMIMNGIEAFKELYEYKKGVKMMIEIRNQSSELSMFITKYFFPFHSMPVEIKNKYMYCLMQIGMYQTEWSVILVIGKNVITLGKGHSEKGHMILFENIRKRMQEGDIEKTLHFDEWPRNARGLIKDWKVSISCMNQTETTNFKNHDDENTRISKTELMNEMKDDFMDILKGIEKTIEESEQKIKSMKEIHFGEGKISLSDWEEKERKVTQIFYDSEVINYPFNQLLIDHLRNRRIDIANTNGTDTLTISGAGYLSRMLSDFMIGEQSYQNDPLELDLKYGNYVEMIHSKQFILQKMNPEKFEKFFPEKDCFSSENISIGHIEVGNYLIIDNINGKQLGTIEIKKQGEYHLIMENGYYFYTRPIYTKEVMSRTGERIKVENENNHLQLSKISKIEKEETKVRPKIIIRKEHKHKHQLPSSCICEYTIDEFVCDVKPYQYKSEEVLKSFDVMPMIEYMKIASDFNQKWLRIKTNITKWKKQMPQYSKKYLDEKTKEFFEIANYDIDKLTSLWEDLKKEYDESM